VTSIIGYTRVIGCAVALGASLYELGHVLRTSSLSQPSFPLGELNGMMTPRVQEVVTVLAPAGPTHATANLWGERWARLTVNCMANALAGITGMNSAAMRASPEVFCITIKIAGEALPVARTLGAQVEPTPWLIAPDFALDSRGGSNETLKDQRGKAVIHLVLFTLSGSRERLSQLNDAREAIAAAGTQIMAVPMRPIAPAERQYLQSLSFPAAVDESPEIPATYTLFRRTVAEAGVPSVPLHLEFLIDHQGYIRARWIPGQSPGWEELPRLLQEIGWLTKEPARAPAPEEHVQSRAPAPAYSGAEMANR
jgi:putative copper resistance protein D